MIKRTVIKESNATICLLDTGLQKNNPLIESHTDEDLIQAVDVSWDVSDKDGHGTEMAGDTLQK